MPASTSPVRDRIIQELFALLDDRRVVVWYDPTNDFSSVFDALSAPSLEKVDARSSALAARRNADAHWPTVSAAGRIAGPSTPRLLVYVPWARGVTEEARMREPFEAYALIGADFGVAAAHSLEALARRALPARTSAIDALFAEHKRVALAQLEALGQDASYPLLKQAFGSDDPLEVSAQIVGSAKKLTKAITAAGVQADLARLLHDAFGFTAGVDVSTWHTAFVQWVLFSEFAFDLGGNVPPSVANIARAGSAFQTITYALCDRLRGSDEWRDAYVDLATQTEERLALGSLANEATSWGDRDTFAFEDTAALGFVQRECLAGRVDIARETIKRRQSSVWRRDPQRSQLWTLATRAVDLLDAAHAWKAGAVSADRPVREHVSAYADEQHGLWRIDRAQRWLESAAGDCTERETLQALFEHTQLVYRQTIDAAQDAFLEAVLRDGWPASGPLQIRVFARHVAPALQQGERVAYFLLDALRFEMGRDLAQMLEALGTVHIEPTATVVPTTTTFGMAALLPGAEAGLGCTLVDGELVPTVSGKPMRGVDDRKKRFEEQLGDRYVDRRLDELLDATDAKLKAAIGRASLLVVRSDDIDKAGEGTNLPSARRFMSSVLGDVKTVVARLARAGITRVVLAADHGHVLLPAVPPGDVLKPPAGEWALSKRRCRLGSALGTTDGVRVVPARHLGVQGPVRDVALASGFRVFAAGSAFFHEGMSLQECIVPTVTLELKKAGKRKSDGPANVAISYRFKKFNQRVFLIKLKLGSWAYPTLDVRIHVLGPTANGDDVTVGQAADCEARDPATGLIRLRVLVEEAVLIRIDDRFTGPDIEIRVIDEAGVGVVLGSLKLANDCLD